MLFRSRLGIEAETPFDLSIGPLWRARLYRVAEQEHVLSLVHALQNRDYGRLREALQDRWHQPARAALVPHLNAVLAIDDPEVRALRERLFGNWEMNWVGYNSATDVELPGAAQQRPNFAFLMYPCAFTTAGQPSAEDPSRFHNEIMSREM